MSQKTVSEQELRSRLLGTLSEKELQELIDKYVEATSDELPNIEEILRLAKKGDEGKSFRVSLTLEEQQYDSLAIYFDEPDLNATALVRKALKEFIQKTVA